VHLFDFEFVGAGVLLGPERFGAVYHWLKAGRTDLFHNFFVGVHTEYRAGLFIDGVTDAIELELGLASLGGPFENYQNRMPLLLASNKFNG